MTLTRKHLAIFFPYGTIWHFKNETNNNIQSASWSHLIESHSVHLSTKWKTCCTQYMTGHPVCIHTCLAEGKKIISLFLLHLTAGLRPASCLLWFTLLKAVTIYFLTFGGHFSSDPACAPLFLALPVLAWTPGFFWPPQLRQQYKAWLA